MGGAVSSIAGVSKMVKSVIGMFMDLGADYAAVKKRVNTKAPLPTPRTVPESNKPYWMASPPHPELVDIQSDDLPDEADIVIIGSGIAAVATARSVLLEARRQVQRQMLREAGWESTHVLKGVDAIGGGGTTTGAWGGGTDSSGSPSEAKAEAPKKEAKKWIPRVVVLEAREICSGATGRNGGHIKASASEMLGRLLRRGVPPKRAAALVRFQVHHLQVLERVCGSSPCGTETQGAADLQELAELRRVETVDFYVGDEANFEKAKREIADMHKWVPECDVKVHSKEEAAARFSASSSVIGAISYVAGAVWPYRLVTHVWKDLLDQFRYNLSIETGTPATAIHVPPFNDEKASQFPYVVTTPRGAIRTQHIVHATNAYTTHLVPGLVGKMTGLLAHMTAQGLDAAFSPGVPDGGRSWSFLYGSGGGGYDYVTQRPDTKPMGIPMPDGSMQTMYYPPRTGELMVGGGFSRSARKGADMVGVYDDGGKAADALTVAHISGIVPSVMDHAEWSLNVTDVWQGVICATGDLLPLVGRLDERVTGRKVPARKRKCSKTNTWIGTGTAAPSICGNADQAGEWIVAGFNGDGMVWAWLCGVALGMMLTRTKAGTTEVPVRRSEGGRVRRPKEGEDDEEEHDTWMPWRPDGRLEEWFPPELYATYDRIKKMNIMDLADEVL